MSTHRRRKVPALIALTALMLAGHSAPAATAVPARQGHASVSAPVASAENSESQWRSLWVDAFNPGLGSPDEIRGVVRQARAARVNVLLVQAAPRMDCLCNSSTLPRRATRLPAPFDPLAEITRQAHAAGIEVHVWINATSLWSGRARPASPRHALNRHGFSAGGAARWLDKRVDGAEIVDGRTHLDLGNPAATAYVVDAVASLQRHYDIDGISLDHIRYPDYSSSGDANDWGYSSTSLARFRAATGRTDRPRPTDPAWSAWRRDQVTALVRRVYVRMAAADPRDRLTVNGITYDTPAPQSWTSSRAYNGVLQDWQGWMRDGIVDGVVAMNYRNGDIPAQAEAYSSWTRSLAAVQAESGRQAVSGAGLWINTVDRSVEQAAEATSAGLGWGGYSYTEPSIVSSARTSLRPSERAALADRLSGQVFTSPADVPAMPWKADPTTGMIQGIVVHGRTPRDQVTMTVRKGGAVVRTVRSDGSGWFGVVGLPPGVYTVQVVGRGVTSTAKRANVRAGRVVPVTVGLVRR